MVQPMLAADEAERRGDAHGALEVVLTHPCQRDGGAFWRPWRVRRLRQLVILEGRLPGWATSRWVLAQAAQLLDAGTRQRGKRAGELAIALRGGLAALPGRDATDAQCQVMDHDWAFRQLLLHELGGLSAFLRTAPTDLLVGADRVAEWAQAPMGGFELVTRTPRSLTWRDLRTDREVEVDNIGSAALVLPGETVIGRLVPVEGGQMFESVPLLVPERVAREVSGAPEEWYEVLRVAPEEEARRFLGGHQFDLLCDVPPDIWLRELLVGGEPDLDPFADGIDRHLVTLLVDQAGYLLDRPRLGDDDVDGWACLGAALLDPAFLGAVGREAAPDELALLGEAGSRLAEPAAAVARDLATAAGQGAV